VTFEEYLIGKNIDSAAFKNAEEKIWMQWKEEFEQMHPNSFTVQKLNLINPIRRKYTLKVIKPQGPSKIETDTSALNPQMPQKPPAAKPVFKPKPKIN
jgi:hypothetical protein